MTFSIPSDFGPATQGTADRLDAVAQQASSFYGQYKTESLPQSQVFALDMRGAVGSPRLRGGGGGDANDAPMPPEKRAKREITDDEIEKLPHFQKLKREIKELTAKNITCIVGSRVRKTQVYADTIEGIYRSRTQLVAHLGNRIPNFASLSAALSRAGAHAGNTLAHILEVLHTHQSTFDAFVGKNRLIPDFKSLSSMLNGAGVHAGNALIGILDALKLHRSTLETFVGKDKIIPDFKNISAILHGAGATAGNVLASTLDTLETHQSTLEKLVGEGKIIPEFKHLSSMLSCAGINASTALTDFLKPEIIQQYSELNDENKNSCLRAGSRLSVKVATLHNHQHQGAPHQVNTPGADDWFAGLVDTLRAARTLQSMRESP